MKGGGIRSLNNEILELLYSRYYKSSFLYTLSLCKNKELAEDIVSDAFVKAYLTLSDEHPSFQYWLLRVCKNLWLDYARRQNKSVDDGNKIILELSHEDTPENQLIQNEQIAVLYKSIRMLSQNDQELLLLHYFSRLPLIEISKLLNVTNCSIKTRIFRARKNLKQFMEENRYDI